MTRSVVFSHKQGAGIEKLSMFHFNRCVEKSKIKDRIHFKHLRNVDTLKSARPGEPYTGKFKALEQF